jgi:hypothetical protein
MTVPRHGRAAPALVMALILGGLALAVIRADLESIARLNLPGPVFIPPADLAPVSATPPRRVMAVLVDGLRADTVAEMPFLVALAASGARLDLHADPPTYSAAQYVAALSGVRPADSGVRGNVGLLRTPLDSVPRRVTERGRVAAEIGDDCDWWLRLFGDDWASAEVVPDGGVADAVRARLAGVDFLWVHLARTDGVGHTLGVAAPEYLAAARETDATLRELALAWGWPENAIAVLSDHGHMWPDGGHGGGEDDVTRSFLIASGAGVLPGARPPAARTIDVAPTLAALAGVPSPMHAMGRTLIEILDAPLAARVTLTAADVARQARVSEAITAGRVGLGRVERRQQALRAFAVLVCAVLAARVVRRARTAARLGLAAGVATLAITAALYVTVYGRVSFSAARDAVPLVMGTIALGFLACAVTFSIPLALALRGRLAPADAGAFAFLAVAGASPAAVAMFVLCGAFTYRFTAGPPWLAAGPLVAYAALIPVALSAFVLSLVAGVRALAVTSTPRRAPRGPVFAASGGKERASRRSGQGRARSAL